MGEGSWETGYGEVVLNDGQCDGVAILGQSY